MYVQYAYNCLYTLTHIEPRLQPPHLIGMLECLGMFGL